MVRFKPEITASARAALKSEYAIRAVEPLRLIEAERWTLIDRVAETVDRLNRDPAVDYAEPDYLLSIFSSGRRIPNDPLFTNQWGLDNAGQGGGRPDADIDAPEAWTTATGGETVVAIVDTGIDLDHEDLVGNLWLNPGEDLDGDGRVTASDRNGIDDDGNGYADDFHGWDFANNDSDPDDDHFLGHGTHVAGTVAAVGDNGLGVAGVSWAARLMAVKFLRGTNGGWTSDAVLALEYAIAGGARIVNASWGGFTFSRALRDAVDALDAAGVLLVAAAGNTSSDNDLMPAYPANYDFGSVVAVAATERHDLLAEFSNFGVRSVDLGAPGVEILSTMPDDQYDLLQGTSMAAPHVSGVAALLLGAAPELSADEVKAKILAAAEPIPALAGKTVTGGRLDARATLEKILPPLIATPDTLDFGRVTVGQPHVRSFELLNSTEAARTVVVESNHPRFVPQPGELTLPAHSSRSVDVVFGPTAPGAQEAELTIDGVIVAATGIAAEMPVIRVSPAELSADLRAGESVAATVTLENVGVANLNWQVEAGTDGLISAVPASGVIAPGVFEEIAIHMNPSGDLSNGVYETIVQVHSDDPVTPLVELPLTLSIGPFARRSPVVPGDEDLTVSNSGGWVDFDGDGHLDLYAVTFDQQKDVLYRGDGRGGFERVISGPAAGPGNESSHGSWADADGDGDLDLLVSDFLVTDRLYWNTGGGALVAATGAGLPTVDGPSYGAAWADYDLDGDLDVFVAHQEEGRFFKNLGDGTFLRRDPDPISGATRWSLTASWGDYDDDGDPDLFVGAVRFGSDLIENRGTSFRLIRNGPIAELPAEQSASDSAWVDFDNDGDLDLSIVSGLLGIVLFRNLGGGDLVRAPGLGDLSLTINGGCWGDLDLDGDLDLYVSADGDQDNYLFENQGDGDFERILGGAAVSDGRAAKACSLGDYDGDGDLDIFVANSGLAFSGGEFDDIYENLGNDHHWLKIRLLGEGANRFGLGTRIWVEATIQGQPVTQMREVGSARGARSQNSLDEVFGLGDATVVDKVRIRFPSGTVRELEQVSADQLLVIEEAAGSCQESPTVLCLQNDRFRVEVEWRDFEGNLGSGHRVAVPSEDSGLVWFFDANNWEMLVKVLDGCAINDRFWVFAAATTDVEYTLRITDTETDTVREYSNPLGNAAAAITDTGAFATCTAAR